MLSVDELKCPQCKCDFESASELLKHFATHAIEELVINTDEGTNEEKHQFSRKTIPALHPIVRKIDNCPEENLIPLTFCEVTFNDGNLNEKVSTREKLQLESKISRKYECLYCKRCFGWPTDLKRHLLTHTGERPYKCNFCESSYTRKFILHQHIIKFHRKPKIPDLKPINSLFTTKFEKGLNESI